MRTLTFALLFLLSSVIAGASEGGPFLPIAPDARNIEGSSIKEDRRAVASVLAVFLGPFGAHRLYLGTTVKVAVIYGITFGGFGILPLLDLGHMLLSKDLQAYRNNGQVFMWNNKAPTPP